MQNKHSYIKSITTILIVVMLFSCKNNFSDVQKIGVSENQPIGVADSIDLKRTDSGRVTVNLISPKMLDFTNREFGYNEFPKGIYLELFDKNSLKSTVIADYAIAYDKTGLIDLQGHVILTSHANDTLFAEQLYYDQNKEWLFTNKPVSFRQGSSLVNGKGFDSDTKFRNAQVLEINGIITVDE